MDTDEIMHTALDLAGMSSIPADSAVHVKGKDIQRVLMCIDAEQSTIMLAKQLGYDAVIAHHPIGRAYIDFYKVLDRHIEFMLNAGIPRDVAEDAVRELRERVMLRAHTSIYTHVTSFAERIGMPLLNIHLPCDELMRRELLRSITGRVERVRDIGSSVEQLDEFRRADTRVEVVHGDEDAVVRRYMLVVAAGTNGGYSVAKAYFEHGYDTVIYLHISPEDLARAKSSNLNGNIVILGHLAGDSLGMNMLADALRGKGLQVDKMGIIDRDGDRGGAG
ncbi:MAG: Nif3-like dinuclear metal center hexameric protein [Candidatus Nitrosocaldus sp.]|nr:Nif3-like dinuclear metal center hexameric protein [Candidatus Nitrosocaldus sp.]MCS7141115.1 Nif3-like dinuclear metal center hexameric protein [Candidatus Nitrosocaldus sp.]MDW8000079.1 Nif3-like dinuclear metal center hexameric protein [Candidatus Nitrosocaldus sp.]MDW8275536.1 Nif3-like dinuclear metal center hexameric protein [Candidatus Nitrosocaldus sp.]